MTGFAGLDTVLRNRQREREREGEGKGERTVMQEEESFSDLLFMIYLNADKNLMRMNSHNSIYQ